jgi:anti-sigma factor ChrR (cupin superfamily)
MSESHDDMQHFVSRNGGYETVQGINVYLHVSYCPVRMQTHENKKQRMLRMAVDGRPDRVCV